MCNCLDEFNECNLEANCNIETRKYKGNKMSKFELVEYAQEYRFKGQEEILIYTGKEGVWHQFIKIDGHKVWAEVKDEDLHLIEKV